MEFLADGGWLPPPVDPAWVIESVAEGRVEACVGRFHGQTVVGTNVVERLAIAHGLLSRRQGEATPPILMETLEALGFNVSASFAESGADAYGLMAIITKLQAGTPFDSIGRTAAYESLGRLWAAAFRAPNGYAHYIARSAEGLEPAGTGFFRAAPDTAKLDPVDEGKYLRRLVDLLQAGVEVKELPAATVGYEVKFSTWRAASWALYLRLPTGASWRLEVHVKQVVLGPGATRFSVKLVEANSKTAVASIRAVIFDGETGSYDDFLTQSALAGKACEKVVEAVFAPGHSVGIYPRVRWLLEAAGDRLFKLAVVEGMYADSVWRQRGIGRFLLQQLLVETTLVDVMIGRPASLELGEDDTPMPLGVQAGYAVAKLSLARYFSEIGAEYLIGGVMGMRLSELQKQHAIGEAARLG